MSKDQSEVVDRAATKMHEAFYAEPSWSPTVWRATARAMITAMREPTRAMIDACGQGPMLPETIWKAMIDESLRS